MVAASSLPQARPLWTQRLAGDTLVARRGLAVHDYTALVYFTAGSAVVQQRERFVVRAGDVYLVPAGERHGLVSARSPEAWGLGFCPACFAPTELAPLLTPFERAAAGACTVVHIPAARQDHLAGLWEELHREGGRDASSAHAEVVMKSLLGLILAEVARAGSGALAAGVGAGFVADALRFIERRCLGPISLGDVAAAVRRSPSHVSTAVRRATGTTVMQWVIAGRLAEARNRLLHTDEMVDVIAERVGYADPTHFIRLFRRSHGLTPAAWRAQQRYHRPGREGAATPARPRRARRSGRG